MASRYIMHIATLLLFTHNTDVKLGQQRIFNAKQ